MHNRIDKAVRERLREGYFGYDHSQFLALQVESNERSLELNDSSFTKLLAQRINQNQNEHKISYQEWKRKKETEDRIKRNLKMKVLREYYEETLMKEQNDEEKIVEGKKHVRQWLKHKIHQSKRRVKALRREKIIQEEIQKEKEQKAKENYRNWLKEKMIKENEEHILRNELNKKKRVDMQKEKEREIELKLQSEQAFQEWLHRKSKSNSKYNTSRLESSRRSYTRSRKPLKQLSSQNELSQRLQIKEVKYSGRPPLPRTAIRVEESSSMSFLSESSESI